MNSWCGGAVIYHVRNFQKVKSVLPKVRNVCLKLTNHLSTNIKSVILCSGQGAQYVGMLKKTLSGKHASKVYQLSELANDVLGYDLLSICLNGPNDVLQKTVHCQPATLLASLVAAEVLKQDQPDIFSQQVEIAGYSVGEIAALVIAGSLNEDQAFLLIRKRAESMQIASDRNPSGMLALTGVQLSDAEKLCKDVVTECEQNRQHGKSFAGVAIDAFPNGCVIGASLDCIVKLQDISAEKGFSITPLPVSGAFHTPLMLPALEIFSSAVEALDIKSPRFVTYSNATGEPYQNREQIKRLLVKQIVERLQWHSVMRNIFKRPQECRTYELGPGRQLKPMIAKFNRTLIRNYSNSD